MQAQLACFLLLCLAGAALCSDVDQEQRALAEELLSSLLSSKVRHSQQSAPYWQASLSSLCRTVGVLHRGSWDGEDQAAAAAAVAAAEEELREGGLQLLEDLYSLRHICRELQSRDERFLPESLEFPEDNSDVPLKRKSPYILKRQAGHNTKSRRPYILKRSPVY
ncbi:uncharacterized protein nts [Cololabis saira]|uniref:uncharacterized protein nts n=1 Tax=Cololabis saira TaxID=129043 RepID=UPI002AD227C5|nr:uncharacterized protein nts [Cololabis saira]